MNHKKIITAFSILFFILIFSNSAFAQYEGIIKYRKNVMKSTGGHMGAIVDILKNGLPLTAHIVDHAHSINKNNKMTLEMFPKGSGLGDTKAKSTIWEMFTPIFQKDNEIANNLALSYFGRNSCGPWGPGAFGTSNAFCRAGTLHKTLYLKLA